MEVRGGPGHLYPFQQHAYCVLISRARGVGVGDGVGVVCKTATVGVVSGVAVRVAVKVG